MSSTAAIQVQGLVKRYGAKTAVDGIDLTVESGEIFALLGPNGAGKTTTVEILEGYRIATAGQVKVLGFNPATKGSAGQKWRNQIGIVLQSTSDAADLSVFETISHYANYYENPRNVGTLDKDDPHVGTGMVGAPACGDVMKLQIKVSDDGIIEDAKFKTYGCGSAIASSSLVTEWLKGKTLDQAYEIKNSAIAEELALPPVKIHCSVLAEDAIKSAIADLKSKQGKLN